MGSISGCCTFKNSKKTILFDVNAYSYNLLVKARNSSPFTNGLRVSRISKKNRHVIKFLLPPGGDPIYLVCG